ncbi:MAG: glycine oxidase ThiO [Candidatus Poribacteria bacterium]|nr:glycine oxidase ThiO [Candidatus Poribacteria bacterium]
MLPKKVAIIGGGVIGLSIGWQLAKNSLDVTIYDRDWAGQGASWAAAGMLSPRAEVHMQERDLLQLGLVSAELYPEWVDELESDSQTSVDYRTHGTLMVALDRDDQAELEDHYEVQRALDLPVEWLTGVEAREIEPYLSPRITSAVSCKSDVQINNRLMVQALIQAFKKFGGNLRQQTSVRKIEIQNEKAIGIQVQEDFIEADLVILSAGCWSSQIDGLPDWVRPPVRPVKGQMIALRMETPPILQHVIYAPDAYLAPKGDGRLLIGATCEEQGFDTKITAGGMFELLRGAWEVLPSIYELPIDETWAGLRPGSRDNAPILGRTQIKNLIMATGHYRQGILLTPVTCREISALIMTGQTSNLIAPFMLERFA